MIPGLLGLGELEPLEVIERSSRPSGDDALVEGVLLPLVVNLSRCPSLNRREMFHNLFNRNLPLQGAIALQKKKL